MLTGNERKCLQCDMSIETPNKVIGHQQMRKEDWERPLTDWWQAWLAGFCSPKCEADHAALAVSTGGAWWQRT